MKMNLLRLIVLFVSILSLTACMGPETPQEVAEAFWQSVLEGDADDVAEFSTLNDPAAYDGFETRWEGADILWGRVVIEGDQASVVTTLKGIEGVDSDGREVLTYLVRQEDQWLVDYEQTARAVKERSAFASFMGQLGRLGEKLSASLDRESDELAEKMDEMSRELEALSESMAESASEALDEFGEQLQKHLDDLAESIEEALKNEKQASPRDRELLEASLQDLNEQNERLDEPDFEAFAGSGKAVAETRIRLRELDSELFEDYRRDWQDLMAQIEDDLAQLVDDLTSRPR